MRKIHSNPLFSGLIGRSICLATISQMLVACGGGGSSDGPAVMPVITTTVEFVYVAATAIDPVIRNQFPACNRLVGSTHIHPGWRNFAVVFLSPIPPSEFRVTFSDVPVGENRIRISDPNVCALNPTGAATNNVSANGVLLTTIVDTPGSGGQEPGLSFSVTANGTVTP